MLGSVLAAGGGTGSKGFQGFFGDMMCGNEERERLEADYIYVLVLATGRWAATLVAWRERLLRYR